ncbi:MAG TPA: hypothetical protein VFS67_17385 [Polyangiaceae bacterium]|nr:hypothetical protein [Polyangiaceae bacterium]
MEARKRPLASQVDALHDFETQGVQFRILDVDGELLTEFSRPAFTPLPTIAARDGQPLTLLETSLALQPEGVPDARLLEDHLARSAELGRPDASVHEARIEPPSVAKTLQDDCIGVAAGFTGGTFVAPFYTKSSLITAQNGSCTSARTASGELGYMLLEACNFAPGALTQSVRFAKKTGFGGFVTQFTSTIAPNNANGIIQNTGNHTTRFDLRARVTSAIPSFSARVVCGTFGEAR